MASLSLFEAFIAIIFFLILHYFLIKKPQNNRIVRNWPVLGMLPSLLMSLNHIYDFLSELLEMSNLTFLFKGPWFAKMDILVTVDPANIHYILTSNFSNYTKGPEFKEVFDVFKDVIFNTDADLWKNLRKAAQATLIHQGFQRFLVASTRSKLENGLVPLFNHFAKEEMIVNMQDLFGRFTFDITMVLITGSDPKCLSTEMPDNEFAKAIIDAGEAIMYRHVKPRLLWKLQNRMGLGLEKKLAKADAIFDRVCSKYISAKLEEVRSQGLNHHHNFINGDGEDLLTSYIKLDATKYELLNPSNDQFLKEVILNFLIAGRDTVASALTWFFWLLSENPRVVDKIRQEINTNIPRSSQEKLRFDYPNELNKLVYLHGALYESMRLYPPVPFERKSGIKQDILPSGHNVEANSKITIVLYALGRMRAVWGEDALEFKPERWVSKTSNGSLKHEPSFKFLPFNAGPRSCLGKQLAIILMKTVVVEILQNYDIEVVNVKLHGLPTQNQLAMNGLAHVPYILFKISSNFRCGILFPNTSP